MIGQSAMRNQKKMKSPSFFLKTDIDFRVNSARAKERVQSHDRAALSQTYCVNIYKRMDWTAN